MGIGSIGVPSMILIVIVALILFGPKKLPEIGKAAGQTLQAFKSSAKDAISDDADDSNDDEAKVEE